MKVNNMTTEYITRMGDGRRLAMTKEQIMDDIEEGCAIAADFAEVPALSENEIDHLMEIVTAKGRVVSVEPGKEIIMTHDGGTLSIESEHTAGVPCGRLLASVFHERGYCMDTVELGHVDYSFKPVKPIIAYECQHMRLIQETVTVPAFYGAMPNMGLYYTPDGPYENPGDLMKAFKIEEGRQSIEKSAEHLTRDIEWIVKKMMNSGGADGFNFDTAGAAGDGDLYASLNAVEAVRKEFPDMYIEMGMASECVLGMHGDLEYKGSGIAGLWTHEQAKLVEKAGANVFGPAVNTNTTKSFAWNIARAVTIVKEASKVSVLPVHVNMGNGVGGVPIFEYPPIDALSKANKAMVELANVDGI
jgi:dimethylamine--corrinoid protein Co-methyltransferase